jgi:hypothetical protein
MAAFSPTRSADPAMKSPRRGVPLTGLRQAFDEVRFGGARTLNLRQWLPTADAATMRTEAWLRQQQVEQAEEVLIITGRGKHSAEGVSVVREAVIRLLHSLKRRGVVAGHEEHTPGSFVVRLAPMRELFEAPRRRRDRKTPLPVAPPSLDALDDETRALLRDLAERAIDALGVREREPFVEGEMLKQFGALAAGLPPGPGRESRLRAAIRAALEQYD